LNPNIGGNPPRSYAALNGSLTRIFHENFREVISIPCGVLIIDGDRRRLKTDQSFAGIIGRDVKMQELFETIRDVSEIDVSALIQGESGTASGCGTGHVIPVFRRLSGIYGWTLNRL